MESVPIKFYGTVKILRELARPSFWGILGQFFWLCYSGLHFFCVDALKMFNRDKRFVCSRLRLLLYFPV